MADIKLKPAYRDVVIGFNNKSVPLGERNDLHLLYDNAKRKNHKAHLDMFEDVSDAEIEEVKAKDFLKRQDAKKRPEEIKSAEKSSSYR